MRFRLALAICGLYLVLIVLSGCETIKGTARGGADGFSKDWQNTKENIKEADDWIRENLW